MRRTRLLPRKTILGARDCYRSCSIATEIWTDRSRLYRIEAYHAVNNPASGKVMKNAGMKYEGRMRKKYRSHIGFEDSDLYAILREDIVNSV